MAEGIKADEILYSPMCYENGTTVDDLLVYMKGKNDYLLIINAGNIDKDYDWIVENSKKFNVEINNISDKVAQLALQGPLAEDILSKLTDQDLSEIEFYKFKQNVNVCSEPCIVSRTGYTGEDGFEIYCDKNVAQKIWDAILEEGKEKVVPAGLGARDTLRSEVNLPLYGHEISEEIPPLEAGLSIFVKLDKDDFIGKDSLKALKESGKARKLVAFELQAKVW